MPSNLHTLLDETRRLLSLVGISVGSHGQLATAFSVGSSGPTDVFFDDPPSTSDEFISDDMSNDLLDLYNYLAMQVGECPTDPGRFNSDDYELVWKLFYSSFKVLRKMGHDLRHDRFSSHVVAGRVRDAIARASEEYVRVLRAWLVQRPELVYLLSAEDVKGILSLRIPWLAYLRSMWNLFWSAILHPLSETTIDLSTGRVLYRT